MLKKGLYIIASILFICLTARAQVVFPDIDVQHYTFAINLNDQDNNIEGRAAMDIKFLNDVSLFELNLVKKDNSGKGMLVSSVTESGRNLKFSQDADDVFIYASAKSNSIHSFTINYSGIPKDGLIISTNKFGHRTFFGDNWPNRAHNWLPCADYPSDKATVDFIVTAPDHYQVVANGLKIAETELPGQMKTTHWEESQPLAPKVMVIGAADFAISRSGTVSGIPVFSYVFPENKDAGFKSYSFAPEILRFYIEKIGPYAYEKLANVQSKTIFGGMENASCIFYFENSPGDKSAEELLAHEIGHQWFGDAVTEKSWQNLWLSEGFATYLTNLYLENKYGPDTLNKREIADRQKVLSFERSRFTPVVDTAVKGNYMQLLNANSYEKGSWALHMLRRKLGDALFWKGLRAYYAKDDGGNVNTADFEQIMEQTSGQHLYQFFKEWLYTAGHPDLKINWKYDAYKKAISITIIQKQETLFQLPREYSVDGKLYKTDISDKTTSFSVPTATKPAKIEMDPNVNLLASFEMVEE